MTPLSITLEGFRRCLTEAEYNSSYGVCSAVPNNIVYTSDFCINYWIEVYNPSLNDRWTWDYYGPDGYPHLSSYWEYVWDEQAQRTIFRSDDGLELGGPFASMYVGFATKNTPFIGQWRLELRQNQELLTTEYFRIEPGLQITLPLDQQPYLLTESDLRATASIPFFAELAPGATTATINWTLGLAYQTTGGLFVDPGENITFSTSPGEQAARIFEGKGGRLTINASALINGSTINAPAINIYISGPTQIPNELIFTRLRDLYTGGETPSLMIGLAFEESSYRQFENITKYEQTLYWPLESRDGATGWGSHIGLMQVATQMGRAFDWHVNTQDGVSWFTGEKRTIALSREGEVRSEAQRLYKDRLPDLNDLQRENMTLVCYGPYASALTNMQYYYYEVIPLPNGKYECNWIINTLNNPNGVQYVTDVRDEAGNH